MAEPLYHRNIRSGSLSTSPTTGWNTPERRRVVNDLRALQKRMYSATDAGTATDAGSIIRSVVLAGRGQPDSIALREETERLSNLLARLEGSPRP